MTVKAYNGTEPYIFVSYARKNSDQVLPLIETMQQKGYRVWFDEGIEVGSEWPAYIARQIVDCSCMLIFMSPEYIESPNCRRELTYAQNKKKECLVIYLQEFTVSVEGVEMQIVNNQAIFYTKYISDQTFLDALMRSSLLEKCRESHTFTEQVEAENFADLCRQVEDDRRGCLDLYDLYGADDIYDNDMEWIYDSVDDIYRLFDLEHTRQYDQIIEKAKQGHITSRFIVGEMYYCGDGLPLDRAKSIKWFTYAAEKGHTAAQFILGTLYESGDDGISRNLTKAAEWYTKAAEQGHEKAKQALVALKELEKQPKTEN